MLRRSVLLRAAVLAFSGALSVAQLAAAHAPVSGATQNYGQNVTLPYDWGGTGYPSWFTTAANGTLTVNWPSSTDNNSATPQFSLVSGGAAKVFYSSSPTSPCSGSSTWLACAKNWGYSNWEIYLRNLQAAPYLTWTWYDYTASCPGGTTCYYARRALIHEVEHVVMSVGSHDSQGETNTVMGSTNPWSPNAGWNTTTIRRCDASAAQLLYDVRSSAGVYADCFDHITGATPSGLASTATVAATSYVACVGSPATPTGRLAIKTDSNYGLRTNNPLTNRTLFFDRRPIGGSWTLNTTSTTATSASGNNWSKSFTSGGAVTYEFRVHYNGETGVAASNQPTFTITWRTTNCPL